MIDLDGSSHGLPSESLDSSQPLSLGSLPGLLESTLASCIRISLEVRYTFGASQQLR